METKNYPYSLKKEMAISNLRTFVPQSNDDVEIIIETILNCYVEVEFEVCNQPDNVKFLIEELSSFINGIRKK